MSSRPLLNGKYIEHMARYSDPSANTIAYYRNTADNDDDGVYQAISGLGGDVIRICSKDFLATIDRDVFEFFTPTLPRDLFPGVRIVRNKDRKVFKIIGFYQDGYKIAPITGGRSFTICGKKLDDYWVFPLFDESQIVPGDTFYVGGLVHNANITLKHFSAFKLGIYYYKPHEPPETLITSYSMLHSYKATMDWKNVRAIRFE